MIYCVKNRYPEVLVSVVLAGLLHQCAQIDAHAFKYSIGVEGFFFFLSSLETQRERCVCCALATRCSAAQPSVVGSTLPVTALFVIVNHELQCFVCILGDRC